MKRLLKILLGGIAVVVLLFVVAATIFALTFDPNDYRDTVATLVKKETGRDLAIEGDLRLSFFPWLGFEVGPTLLSDAPGFGDQPFARFDGASARVKLMPLLSKQIEIGQLSLRGLDLKLVRRPDGSANWDDLAELGSSETAPEAQSGGQFTAQSIGSVALLDAKVHFADGAAKADYRVTDWNLRTGRLVPGEPFDLDTDLALTSAEPAMSLTVAASGQASSDLETGSFGLRSPRVKLALSGADIPLSRLDIDIEGEQLGLVGETLTLAAPLIRFDGSGSGDYERLKGSVRADAFSLAGGNVFEIGAPKIELTARGAAVPGDGADVNLSFAALKGSLDAQTLEFPGLALQAYGLDVTGSGQGEQIFDAPVWRGKLVVKEFSPKDLARKLAIELPPTADPNVLSRAGGRANFVLRENVARLRNVELTLDDTALTGTLGIADMKKEALRFELVADKLNVDRYLQPVAEGAGGEAAADDAVLIPTEELRALNIAGTIEIGEMVFMGIHSSEVKLGLKANEGRVRVSPASAKLYGGTYAGNIRVDVRGESPKLGLDERLEGVQFGDLAGDLFGSRKLSGIVTGNAKLTAIGETASQLRSTLSGNVGFSFVDGAYEGSNIWYEIDRALAVVGKGDTPAAPGENRTVFTKLSGSGKVTNGILRTEDLAADLPFMEVSGGGNMNLPSEELDMKLDFKIVKTARISDAAREFAGATIPVTIKGPIASPSVRPDAGGYLKAKAEQEIDKKKEELKDKALDKLGLGGLLGTKKDDEAVEVPAADQKEAAEAEPEKDPEEQLKDKLKDLFGGG